MRCRISLKTAARLLVPFNGLPASDCPRKSPLCTNLSIYVQLYIILVLLLIFKQYRLVFVVFLYLVQSYAFSILVRIFLSFGHVFFEAGISMYSLSTGAEVRTSVGVREVHGQVWTAPSWHGHKQASIPPRKHLANGNFHCALL